MADVKPFSQYLAEAKAKIGAQNAGPDFSKLAPIASANQPGKQDALSWFIDILSRPMRAVQNPINQTLNEIQKMQESEKTGKPYDALGGFGNVATAGVRGFFSNNPEDQPAGNQLIEKTTDVIGQAQNPKYKNVEDNVNPWVKGIGGFALDVGLDPLTYIPGAVFVKAGQAIGKVAKGAAEGASAAVAGTKLGKVATEAIKRGNIAEKIVADVNATSDVTNVNKLIDTTGHMMDKAYKEPALFDVPKADAKAAKAVAETMAIDSKITSDAIDNAASGAKMAAAGERVPSFSENLAAKGDAVAPLRGFSDAIQANKAALENPVWTNDNLPEKAFEWMREVRAQAAKDPKFTLKIPQTTNHGAATWTAKDLIALPERLRRLNAEATPQSLGNAKQIQKMWLTAFKQANPLPMKMSEMLADLKAANPARKAEISAAIGPKAFDQLAKMNPATFVKATDHLAEALAGKVELANPAKMTTTPEKFVREVMAHNDIEIPSLKSVQNRSDSIVGSDLAVVNEAAVDAGKTIVTAPELSNIPEENVRILAKTLTTFLKDFLKLDSYVYRTKTGVWRTAEELWTGLGKRPYELNGRDQLTLFQESVRDITAEIKALPKTLAGSARSNELYASLMSRFRDVVKWFDDKGGAFFIGVGENKVRMDYAQMFTIMNDKISKEGLLHTNVLRLAIGNFDTLVPVTNIERATLLVLKNPEASLDEIKRALQASIRTSEKATPPPNALLASKNSKLVMSHYIKEPLVKDPSGLIRYVPNGKKGVYGMVDPEKYADQLAYLIKESTPKFQEQVAKNMEAASTRLIAESRDLSVAEFKALFEFIDVPEKLADSIRAMANLETSVITRGTKARVTPEAQKSAAVIVGEAANETAVNTAKRAVQTEDIIRKSDDPKLPTAKRQAKTRKEAVANNGKAYDANEKIAKAEVDAAKLPEDGYAPDGSIVDPQVHSEAIGAHVLNTHIGDQISPLDRFFNISANAERTVPRFLAGKAQFTEGRAKYKMALENIVREFRGLIPGTDTTIITQAFRNVAKSVLQGEKITSPATAAAEEALKPLIQTVFGLTNENKILESLFLRAGGTEIDMLAYLNKSGIDFPFDLDLAKRMVEDGQYASLTEAIVSQWAKVFENVDRPIELLDTAHRAGSLMVMDKAIAQSLLRVEDLTSNVAKNGYGMVPAGLDPMSHPLLAHLPEGTYIDAQYMTEIKRIEEIMMENRTFSGPFGTWLNETYMPILNTWKKGVTIFRPGHHFRNLFSDLSIQHVAEGTKYFRRAATAAMRVLAAKKAYTDVDWVATIQNIGKESGKNGIDVAKMPTANEVLFSSPKWGDVTIGRLFEAVDSHGTFVDFKNSQDVLDEMVAKSNIQKASSFVGLEGTKAEKLAASVAEYQAHFGRLSHIIQILMKDAKSGKTFDQAVEAAVWRAKRHHPDSTMLASGEAKLRAAIPFYTWFRLTMPVLAEGIATHPGRFMVYPKAWYNGAIAMGVDPYSMSDPFPQDQLFPSFLRSQINGPVGQIDGNYYGLNPGVAYFDVLNQFVPNPVKGALGMTTPLVKIPMELIGGSQWQTGAKIKDYSDYVDSSLPGINYLANVTGYSVTGSLWGTLSGTGADKQLAEQKGDKTFTDKMLSIANWFTGLGINNMSKQSYIDFAEIEKRNQAAQDKAQQNGTARSPF